MGIHHFLGNGYIRPIKIPKLSSSEVFPEIKFRLAQVYSNKEIVSYIKWIDFGEYYLLTIIFLVRKSVLFSLEI